MRSLIVDDEADSRARLIRMLGSHPEISVIGEAQDGLEAVEKIETLKPDLLFLDIQMPGLTGFDVLRSIRPGISLPLVIFITGYDQHALAAFEADALAYLLKPVEPERLTGAVDRALKLDAFSEQKEKQRESILRAARARPDVLRLPKTWARCACSGRADLMVRGARWHCQGQYLESGIIQSSL